MAPKHIHRPKSEAAGPTLRSVEAPEMIEAAVEMIQRLNWNQFNTLVDLMFTANGYRGGGEVGDVQTDFGLSLVHPATNERALVQVKSKASGSVLYECVEAFRRTPGHDRFFLVCHTLEDGLEEFPGPPIHLWTGRQLARQAIQSGLYDWLAARTR